MKKEAICEDICAQLNIIERYFAKDETNPGERNLAFDEFTRTYNRVKDRLKSSSLRKSVQGQSSFNLRRLLDWPCSQR